MDKDRLLTELACLGGTVKIDEDVPDYKEGAYMLGYDDAVSDALALVRHYFTRMEGEE